MSVSVVQGARPVPSSVALPAGIEIQQFLQSDVPAGEQILIEYRLSPMHNIWFDIGRLAKSVVIPETVGAGGSAFAHELRLVFTHDAPNQDSFMINEIITNGDGSKFGVTFGVGL
jgi:hypothetical protein